MTKVEKLFFLLLVVISSLVLREMPYINVLVAGRLWVFYLLLLVALFIFSLSSYLIAYKKSFLLVVALIFLGGGLLVLTLLKLTYFAEFLGVITYFLLWLILYLRFRDVFLKK